MIKNICYAFILLTTIVSLSAKDNKDITNLEINHQNNSIVDNGDGEGYIIEIDLPTEKTFKDILFYCNDKTYNDLILFLLNSHEIKKRGLKISIKNYDSNEKKLLQKIPQKYSGNISFLDVFKIINKEIGCLIIFKNNEIIIDFSRKTLFNEIYSDGNLLWAYGFDNDNLIVEIFCDVFTGWIDLDGIIAVKDNKNIISHSKRFWKGHCTIYLSKEDCKSLDNITIDIPMTVFDKTVEYHIPILSNKNFIGFQQIVKKQILGYCPATLKTNKWGRFFILYDKDWEENINVIVEKEKYLPVIINYLFFNGFYKEFVNSAKIKASDLFTNYWFRVDNLENVKEDTLGSLFVSYGANGLMKQIDLKISDRNAKSSNFGDVYEEEIVANNDNQPEL